jgi:hypothetical protein
VLDPSRYDSSNRQTKRRHQEEEEERGKRGGGEDQESVKPATTVIYWASLSSLKLWEWKWWGGTSVQGSQTRGEVSGERSRPWFGGERRERSRRQEFVLL